MTGKSQSNNVTTEQPTRREFVQMSSAAALGAAIASSVVSSGVYAAENNTIKIGLVGCGGRGGGAAINALGADKNLKLVALGDMFKDKLEAKLKQLRTQAGKQIDVPAENQFSGWDAYKGVINASDVVLLATPPHFRPMHLKAVIEAGKHCFCEKPVGSRRPGRALGHGNQQAGQGEKPQPCLRPVLPI
jgi:myo-inositol 2-dehydrogenase/D-chiro-inositol 1-dehydrogenase